MLRDEHTKLPWGFGLEIELGGVDYGDVQLVTQGGLRLSYSRRPEDAPLPSLHAGDEVTVVAQAKRPPFSEMKELSIGARTSRRKGLTWLRRCARQS